MSHVAPFQTSGGHSNTYYTAPRSPVIVCMCARVCVEEGWGGEGSGCVCVREAVLLLLLVCEVGVWMWGGML